LLIFIVESLEIGSPLVGILPEKKRCFPMTINFW
jgi:hypothetical protein